MTFAPFSMFKEAKGYTPNVNPRGRMQTDGQCTLLCPNKLNNLSRQLPGQNIPSFW